MLPPASFVLKTEGVGFSNMLVTIYQTTRCRNPHHSLYIH